MIIFSLLFFESMVNLENFDFGVKILGDIIFEAPEIYKSISFY